jgi:predicted acyltransferase
MLTLGSFIWIVDYLGIKNWTRPGVIFGANAITAYVLAGMLTVVFYNSFGDFAGLNKLFVDGVGSLIGFKLASLVYALIYVGIIFIPVYVLYVKKIFIKL